MRYERTPEVTEARRLAEESRLRAAEVPEASLLRTVEEWATVAKNDAVVGGEDVLNAEIDEELSDEELSDEEFTDEEFPDELTPEEELAYLRHEHSVLMAFNATLRASYSAAAQEASALRRQLLSRAPTVRERAAITALNASIALNPYESVTYTAVRAVRFADALMLALKGDIDEP